MRLRNAYLVTCREVVKDPVTGAIVRLLCTYDPATRGGDAPDGRKVKATLHWVADSDAVDGEVRLYDRLFSVADPSDDEGKDWRTFLNPHSLDRRPGLQTRAVAGSLPEGTRVQFERLGYFCVDPDSTPGAPVFNRTVTLKDSWAGWRLQGEIDD